MGSSTHNDPFSSFYSDRYSTFYRKYRSNNTSSSFPMETNTLLFIILFVLSILISSIHSKRSRSKARNPPGPPGLPIIGNLHQLKSPLHEYFWQLSKKFGPLFYLKLGSRPVIVANSPKMAEEILKTQDLIFCSRSSLLAPNKLSYDSFDIAFSPYTECWREMRKNCVLHLLSVKRVNSFRPIREDEVSRMIGLLSQHASACEKVDLIDTIMFLTSTIISRVAFGKRFEQGSRERTRFWDNIREFQNALSDFYFTDYFPWMGWIDLLTGKIGHLDKVFKKWDSFYQQLIDEHLKPNKPESMEGDVTDILLQLREDELGSFDLSLDHIKAVLMNVYFASTDAIATTTIWVMTGLIKNPRVMNKAQAEIRDFMSSQPRKKKMVEEEDIALADLPYLNAVIREGMRMYTPIPLLLSRETMKNCTIDGFEIPAKTIVHVNAWALSHDPDLWKDPKEFKPERFLVDNKLIAMDYRLGMDFELIPFGFGRRGCPGISMALVTVQLVMANLLYFFDWELPHGFKSEDVDTDILDGLTMHKKNPLYLIPKKFA